MSVLIRSVRESRAAALGKNLVVARLLAGITQHELASRSGVSRATIAQLETGISDPRLTTIADLATALHLSPIVLISGMAEVSALSRLPADLLRRPVEISTGDMTRMELLVRSGLLSDRGRAAHIGAAAARAAGETGPASALAAGIFSAFVPGDGTIVGISLGRLAGEIGIAGE